MAPHFMGRGAEAYRRAPFPSAAAPPWALGPPVSSVLILPAAGPSGAAVRGSLLADAPSSHLAGSVFISFSSLRCSFVGVQVGMLCGSLHTPTVSDFAFSLLRCTLQKLDTLISVFLSVPWWCFPVTVLGLGRGTFWSACPCGKARFSLCLASSRPVPWGCAGWLLGDAGAPLFIFLPRGTPRA